MKKIIITLTIVSMLFAIPSKAQFGEIRGTVTDNSTGEPLIGATVSYEDNGIPKGVITDIDGRYVIKPLTPGMYTLSFSFVTFNPHTVEDILVSVNKATYIDAQLLPDNELPPVVITYEPPMIDKGITPTMTVLDPEQIEHATDRDIVGLAATTAGVFQQDRGGALYVRGARSNSTQYVVDGVKMIGGFSLPNSAIAEVTVITGGIPAMFGDATGGIVLITTKSYKNRHKYR